ncbi:hypothetical protein [Synechocystis sp. PCC 6714]|uniref:hypothetical protein n=1 Tax=Synechocystis sp. (strain PCC 6714) TaxID=1147 RepID=UPI00042113AA|nr:hypothetical protein [Synechocystis sp. PCC 6714]AIE76164.1 hypothetical protein D082_50020 [Synechocystis sp. PCC 6714]
MINLAIDLAQGFGNYLTQADYDTAYTLLVPELQQQYSPQTLRQTVEEMISYGSGSIEKAGEDFAEAVSVIVHHREGKLLIRWLEWGRP